MVRQRKNQTASSKTTGKQSDKNSSSSNCSNFTNRSNNTFKGYINFWKEFLLCVVIIVAVSFSYIGYLETRVNTPYDNKRITIKSGLDVPEKFWGTYRPGTYFGLKTRDKESLVTGLMWYFPRRLKPGGDGIRHWCEQSDNLDRYGWLQHDGINFGIQEIIDSPFILTSSFAKINGGSHGGDWSARINVEILPTYSAFQGEEVSLIWYVALDETTKGHIWSSNSETTFTGIKGETEGLGEFSIKLSNHSGLVDSESFLITRTPGLHLLREVTISSLRLVQYRKDSKKRVMLAGNLLKDEEKNPNFVATQITGIVPFTLDVVFESGSFGIRERTLSGNTYTNLLNKYQMTFEEKFEEIFNLRKKGFNTKSIKFAQAALSNLIGGIGYFYGASKVQSSYTSEPVNYWNAPLFTAVPSRSFFPRGFLWDEGFHGLLISKWDIHLELDIIGHWMDLMNAEGWIPREQILGVEALAKVPNEFVVQKNTNANPPTFFITLQFILDNYENELDSGQLAMIRRLYPRLQAWFSWFNSTQKGSLPGSYRWRGRDGSTKKELNPKTLTSGLDDYPRASHPTDEERHIDLYCWMAVAASTMNRLGTLLGYDTSRYEATELYLKNNALMDSLHWSSYTNTYADYGLHTDSVTLRRPDIVPRSPNQNREMVRVVLKNPEYRFIDTTFGYVSLFPFLLKILEPTSPNLGLILEKIRKPELLWTNYGLRSLSINSPLYMKRNTEHDPPYWRGQIWININYLAVRALHYYSNRDGPYQKDAAKLYKELRVNVIQNLIRQYEKSGYLWEQYNDETGQGSGCRPFTGWTALVLSIMSEQY
ncbi:mannosyl-oligosaccharide glucosidase [Coccinella septempunctata]|uniref:mannosyl-oligosaccharide glucosidase n=1 Tax=Coccinella septempunctata TaxID=41139 RepID=UPI001D06C77C|nr:mannosyl-oligosaccharide glucosidase [Coccinella septempunctata]